MSVKNSFPWMSIAIMLLVALVFWIPLIATNWPEVYQIWAKNACQKHDGRCDYQQATAILTLILNAFTLVVLLFQAFVFWGQKQIAETQTNIQRAQHIAANRPRLQIRGCILTSKAVTDNETGIIQQNFAVRFTVINTGSSDAFIEAGRRWLLLSDLFPPRYISLKTGTYLRGEIIKAGKRRDITSVSGQTVSKPFKKEEFFKEQMRNGSRFYLQGGFIYSDDNGTIHHMGFCRTFHPPDGKPTTSEDPDLEYSD